MIMNNVTFATNSVEKAIDAYKLHCAKGHGLTKNAIEKFTHGFSVEPSVAQKLNTKIQEKNEFLKKINMIPVRDLNGQNILIGTSGPSSSRTDTRNNTRREPLEAPELEAFNYQLHKINTDVVFTYAQIDSWSRFSDFTSRFQLITQTRIGLDRVLCGWYGETAEKQTDIQVHPQLQDLAPGWMQYMREKYPNNILIEGATVGEVRIGTGGDFETLDMAVSDLVSVIEDKGLDTSELVVIVGRELLQMERNRVYGQGNSLTPEQKQVFENSRITFSGIPLERASQLPPRFLAVTPLNNLSIYHQEDSYRRLIKDEPEFDRFVDYTSRNEGYVVEDPRLFVGVEFKNVKLPDGQSGWA